jgi:hypothetical protein
MRIKNSKILIFIAGVFLFSVFVYAETISKKDAARQKPGYLNFLPQGQEVEIYKGGKRYYLGEESANETPEIGEPSNVEIYTPPQPKEENLDWEKYLNKEEIERIEKSIIPLIQQGNYEGNIEALLGNSANILTPSGD